MKCSKPEHRRRRLIFRQKAAFSSHLERELFRISLCPYTWANGFICDQMELWYFLIIIDSLSFHPLRMRSIFLSNSVRTMNWVINWNGKEKLSAPLISERLEIIRQDSKANVPFGGGYIAVAALLGDIFDGRNFHWPLLIVFSLWKSLGKQSAEHLCVRVGILSVQTDCLQRCLAAASS